MSTAVGEYGNSSNMHVSRSHLPPYAGLCWKGLVVIAGALLTTALHPANGAAINARSPALADVQTAIALAKDGDTVIVPAGTANWANQLTITKGITLQGQTTITGAGTSTPTASDKTIIKNDVTSKSNMLNISITAAQSFRLTGFTFQANLSKGTQVNVGSSGSAPSAPVTKMRIDHNHFVGWTDRAVWTGGWVYGVADHNYMQSAGAAQFFFLNMATYGGKLGGHGAWADYPWFGTDKFFFIEDNTMIGSASQVGNGATDAENGARFVVRHNYLYNAKVGNHGTEGGNRGGRAIECYNNTFNWTNTPGSMLRSGNALWHDNNYTGKTSSNNAITTISIFREFGGVWNCPFGFGDGTGQFDQNDTEGNGTFVDGHSPHVFESGTAVSGSQSSNATLTDSSKNWKVNQWAGYSVKQTNPSSPCYGKGSYIISNTANTLTYSYYGATDRGPTLKFAAGDTYQIHKVLVAIDQAGRGKGDLLSGNTSAPMANTVAGHTSAHQALEPVMSWNNVHTDGTAYGYSGAAPTVVGGRDYYNLGKGFPANSTPSQVSSTYTASLNGVAYTGTYTYPHPLTNDLLPPSNLAIVP